MGGRELKRPPRQTAAAVARRTRAEERELALEAGASRAVGLVVIERRRGRIEARVKVGGAKPSPPFLASKTGRRGRVEQRPLRTSRPLQHR